MQVDDSDPHIHVPRQVVQASVPFRSVIASTLGLVTDAPSVVATGCGRRVPYVMTSPRPEKVTCLACREFAQQEHRAFAGQVERLSRMPGVNITASDAAKAADRHRTLARQFAD